MTLGTLAADLIGTAVTRGARALLVIETPRDPRTPDARTPDAVRAPDRADRLTARLGTENRYLVHDARERLDPALLAAEAGTVPAGGLLVLMLTPPERSPLGPSCPRFRTRLERLLLEHLAAEPSTSARVTASVDAVTTLRHALPGLFPAHSFVPSGTGHPDAAPAERPIASPTAIAAQDRLLERALAHLQQSPRPLVVVEGPRGHGKSALLGRLAAAIERTDTSLVVTAARRSATDALERHRRRASSPATLAPLPFLPPDVALARGGDTLLVDEAANLPLPVLENLLGRWHRLVLATTSAGYESAGRAFALRLPAILDRERPGWLRLTPREPMRWRAGDPLDALLARVTLTNSTLADPSIDALAALPDLLATRVDRDALVGDEDRLASLHGLLAATHYQSTPLDLAHLLDSPALALWSLEHAGHALGAALVAIEPDTEPVLRADVLARRRRLPHRLLPQLLAQSADRPDALGARFARIVRLSVHPGARRRGIASRLVDAVMHDTRDEVEALGASFGETAGTVAFWAANGFTPFHRGYRRNPRSGRRALAVLRARSTRTLEVLHVAAAVHRDNAFAEAAGSTGLAPLPGRTGTPAGTPDHDIALLRRFASGERTFSDTRAALYRLARRGRPSTGSVDGRPDEAAAGGDERELGAVERLLHELGLDIAPSRGRQDAELREWVRARLDDPG
mgnify:CR=1 FL=1